MTIFGISINRKQLFLLLIDICLVLFAISIANFIRLEVPLTIDSFLEQLSTRTGASFFAVCVHVSVLYVFECYNTNTDFRRLRNQLRILLAVVGAGITLSVIYYFLPNWRFGRGVLTVHSIILAISLLLFRLSFSLMNRKTGALIRVVIVGAGKSGRLMARTLNGDPQYEMQAIAFIDIRDDRSGEAEGLPVVKPEQDLMQQLRNLSANMVVVSGTTGWNERLMARILSLRVSGMPVVEMSELFKRLTGRVPVAYVDNGFFIFGPGFSENASGFTRNFFRLLDIFIAGVGLVLALPILILVIPLMLLFQGRPIYFAQERLGKNEEPFTLFKLRTMVQGAENQSGPQWSTQGDSRVTRLGRFLRRSRIDELPQLWNILRGDMSIIGPRPERRFFVDQLKEKIPFYGLRFAVRPGLTGWAQVNYRYGASEEDALRKLEYEMFYIQEMSLFLNLLILLKTVQTVLLKRGS